MQLKGNIPLEIISTNSNSQVGWKDLYGVKVLPYSAGQTIPTIRITVPSGNPEIYLCTFHEQTITSDNGDSCKTITFNKGWFFRTDGSVDAPSYWGAADFTAFQFSWGNASGTDWSYVSTSTRQIDFNSHSQTFEQGTTVIHHISLFSTRLDLLTITWL